MGEITLFPGRIVTRWYTEEETVWPGSVAELGRYFFYALEIDPAFTMGDLFDLLDRDDVDFLAAVLGEDVVPLVEEARTPPGGHADVRIDFLTVSNVHEDGHLRHEFHGWGPWDEPYAGAWEKEPDFPRRGAIAVSLTPVNQLRDVPLRYEPEVVFVGSGAPEEFRTRIGITLIEFLKAIFYELTFHGPPTERDEVRDELQRRVEEIERGDVEMIPGEQVLDEIRNRLDRREEQ
jgi:hypothetical protein